MRCFSSWFLSWGKQLKFGRDSSSKPGRYFLLNQELIIASPTVITRGTVKATASVIGGGGFNFGPTTSSSSLARAAALPEVSLLLPSLLMGLIVFGALMAL